MPSSSDAPITESAPTLGSVLVVDDEPNVCRVLVDYLVDAGYSARAVHDGRTALEVLALDPPDLMVLDLMLPGVQGLDVLRQIRHQGSDVAVIVVSAKDREGDRLAGLDLGADDYVTKPASPREIVSRVRAVLRRTTQPAGRPVVCGSLSIDPIGRSVRHDGQPVDLAPKEFDLLYHLASNPGKAFSRAELLASVWGSSPEWQDPSTVTVHVRRLRRRIEADHDKPRHLKTVYGVGYRWEAD